MAQPGSKERVGPGDETSMPSLLGHTAASILKKFQSLLRLGAQEEPTVGSLNSLKLDEIKSEKEKDPSPQSGITPLSGLTALSVFFLLRRFVGSFS